MSIKHLVQLSVACAFLQGGALSASIVNLGYVSYDADAVAQGIDQVSVYNYTGTNLGCDATAGFTGCSPLQFSNLSITVTYVTPNSPSGTGSPNSTKIFNQPGSYGPGAYGGNSGLYPLGNLVFSLGTVVTINFSGTFTPGQFKIVDPMTNQTSTGFYQAASQNFSGTIANGPSTTALITADVTPASSTAPEPSTFLLGTSMLSLGFVYRRITQNQA